MNAAPPDGIPASRPPATDARLGQWAELLAEMSALHAKLEYMRLMLRLQQADASPPDVAG